MTQQVLPGRFHTTRSISGLCVRPHKPVVPLGTQPFTHTPSARPPEPAVRQLCYIKALLLFFPSSDSFLHVF